MTGKEAEGMIQRHRWLVISVVACAFGVILAVFVPHGSKVSAPPPTPARDDVFIDNVGLVSTAFIAAKSGTLLVKESLAQFLVYITARPAQGDIETYTLETASAWHIGGEHEDNGIVLFIFPDARVARLEVGYGLEGALPDGLVRDLLDDTLVDRFGHGAYEAGIDALISRVMAILDDDSALRRTDESAGSWNATIRSALIRSPRLAWRTWRIFVAADLNGRFAIELFVLVAFYVVGSALFFAFKVLAALALLPRHWRESPARLARRVAWERNAVHYGGREIERPPSIVDVLGDLRLKDIALGSWGFAFSFAVVVGILLQVENILPRKGHFGGAGVTVTWPLPPGSGPR